MKVIEGGPGPGGYVPEPVPANSLQSKKPPGSRGRVLSYRFFCKAL